MLNINVMIYNSLLNFRFILRMICLVMSGISVFIHEFPLASITVSRKLIEFI